MQTRWITLAALSLLMSSASFVHADAVYGFVGITNNKAADVAIGEAQLFVTVSDAGSSQVSFLFENIGPAASSITRIYFDDGSLLGISSVVSGPGVDFVNGGGPGPSDLPGAENIDFSVTAGFLAKADSPVEVSGVNPGEWVEIIFNLLPGKTYQDTLDAIALSLANPGVDMTDGLRIGIHVQGFAGGGSESFVLVPLPAGLLGGSMLMGLVAVKRRR